MAGSQKRRWERLSRDKLGTVDGAEGEAGDINQRPASSEAAEICTSTENYGVRRMIHRPA
jgi:hypothetical protein